MQFSAILDNITLVTLKPILTCKESPCLNMFRVNLSISVSHDRLGESGEESKSKTFSDRYQILSSLVVLWTECFFVVYKHRQEMTDIGLDGKKRPNAAF